MPTTSVRRLISLFSRSFIRPWRAGQACVALSLVSVRGG
jgi:hypothetical protein